MGQTLILQIFTSFLLVLFLATVSMDIAVFVAELSIDGAVLGATLSGFQHFIVF